LNARAVRSDAVRKRGYNDRVLTLIAFLAIPVDRTAVEIEPPAAVFDPVAARGAHLSPAEPRVLSKKEEWLREKTLRPDFHTSDRDLELAGKAARRPARRRPNAVGTDPGARPGERIEPVTTLFNVWTHEALPILPGQSVETRFHQFLRDHFTNQATHMDTRLVDVLTRVADKFSAKRIDVVSGYRSPKYNLMLRKKGHQVARHSQHMEGNAVDFRVRGVATRQVLHFVRSLRVGGVGFYPHSQFVHSDTGRIRYWTGS
jgi:hypothetical protein